MTAHDAASRLAAVLLAENAALARLDAAAAGALLDEKLAATSALPATGVPADAAQHLRALAAENKRLLEHAILVQGRIMAMVARAALQSPPVSRYGAQGAAVPAAGAIALIKQA